MKHIGLFLACLFFAGYAMAQTTERVTIDGTTSDNTFITNISFQGSNAQLTYENGTQNTVDISTLSIDFDYMALLNDANDASNQVMFNTFGGKTVQVELTLAVDNEQWNMICLPFSMTANQIKSVFGNGTKVASFSGATDDVLEFTTVETIEAGLPYIINPTNSVSTITIEEAELQNFVSGGSVSTSDYSFIGTMSSVSPTGDSYYFGTGNKIQKLAEGDHVKAFHAYFSSNGASPKAFTVDGVTVSSGNLLGDVNGDGEVNITDVVLLVEHILDIDNPSFIIENADINSDNTINITDATLLVNIILEKQ
jgi:hypothetical protein